MSNLPTPEELDAFGETLPYNLATAVFHLSAFYCKGYSDSSRQFAISSLKLYKKNPVPFFVHSSQAFLVEHKTTLYPGNIFLYLHRIVMENKNPMAVVNHCNKLIEILENAKPSA
jgi:hypothetical protein